MHFLRKEKNIKTQARPHAMVVCAVRSGRRKRIMTEPFKWIYCSIVVRIGGGWEEGRRGGGEGSIQFNSIQFICIAQFHKLQICLGVLYNLYT